MSDTEPREEPPGKPLEAANPDASATEHKAETSGDTETPVKPNDRADAVDGSESKTGPKTEPPLSKLPQWIKRDFRFIHVFEIIGVVVAVAALIFLAKETSILSDQIRLQREQALQQQQTAATAAVLEVISAIDDARQRTPSSERFQLGSLAYRVAHASRVLEPVGDDTLSYERGLLLRAVIEAGEPIERGSNLHQLNADFTRSNLARFADTSNTLKADRANLEGSSFRSVQLPNADLGWANLRNADLRFARLRDSDLVGTSFPSADLSRANFAGSDLSGAIFEGADLYGANFAHIEYDSLYVFSEKYYEHHNQRPRETALFIYAGMSGRYGADGAPGFCRAARLDSITVPQHLAQQICEHCPDGITEIYISDDNEPEYAIGNPTTCESVNRRR